MSNWLKGMKQKFNAEELAKKAKEDKDAQDRRDREESAFRQLESYVKMTLKELDGKKTKDGKKLRLELDKERNCVTMYAGEEKFLYLHFWYKENERYDSDGCSFGDGTYDLRKEVHYVRPHKDRHGYNENKDGKWGLLYDEDLAYYLLKFLDI